MIGTIPDQEYFSIGEISRVTQVAPPVLRYWEDQFNLLRPSRRESGHRKYNRKDIEMILKIKELLYVRRFTVAGAKRFLVQESRKKPEQLKIELQETGAAIALLKETKETLEGIVKALK